MARTRKPPWKRERPKGARRTKLTASAKRSARRRAKKSGRRYPSLVDNMQAANKQRKRKRRKRA